MCITPKVEQIFFEPKGDEKGWLVAIENSRSIPFDVKRVYYIFNTEQDVIRGRHAHKNLKQLLICVSGSVDIYCEYDGKKETYHLDSPCQGLVLEGLVWREMLYFTSNAVLLVLASDYYNESDYIRNYEEFLSVARKTN